MRFEEHFPPKTQHKQGTTREENTPKQGKNFQEQEHSYGIKTTKSNLNQELDALEKPAKLPGQAVPGQTQQAQQPGAQGEEQPASGPPPLEGDEAHGEQVAKKPMPLGRGIPAHLLKPQAGPAQPVAPQPAPTQSAPPQPAPTQPAATQAAPVEQMAKMSFEERAPKITKRMDKGTQGAPIPVCVNFIPIKSVTGGIYQFAVSYSPDIESKNMRYKMLNEHRPLIGKTRAFDGAVLFLPKMLDEKVTVLKSTRETDEAEITVTVTFVKKLDPGDRQCVQLYNIMFRRIMKILEMTQVGRYYYDPKRPVPIPQHKLELWPGYITAIEHYEGGLMLLADVSHRLLRVESVLQFMYDFYQKKPNNFQSEVIKALVGSIVLTRYNNKTYRIDDIEWNKNPQATFTYHSGEEMSYVEYYKKAYNKTIDDLEQPLLIHRPKPKKGQRAPVNEVICLVPELCSMTGLTDEIRSDFRVMKDISAHTRVSPAQREQAMLKFVNNVYSNPEALEEMMSWGLEIDRSILETKGRQLPSEKILLGSSTFTASREADWGREATRETVISAVNLRNWLVVFTKRDESKALEFCNTMFKCAPQMGIQVAQPTHVQLRDDRTETYLKSIRDHLNPNVQVVVTIFPSSRDDRYAAVKKLCCIESPVPSQRSVMVVGIDVYHDAGKGGKSIAGLVASTNKQFTRWYSRVCKQQPGQELIDSLKVSFADALKKYHEINHDLPERIIVYRDGVGDGQLHIVANYEVQQLSESFALFESYKPKLAVIVVQKRINMRIFAANGNGGGQRKLDNPPPGTVLDHTITRKDWFDFFLISQHVRQGTVTPTHYVVVHDESGLKADHLQRLSYKLTHLYYNWPGTVRVPAPCQYAHKLAYLVGCSLHNEPAVELSDRLFFL
eukprot:Seg928.2 transcript_id=Seg928.2/GoldUCD/mRNA.D3Y31 product="Piwi-like protein 2" protein_id=Seg928.2/GoldUCD/D3Y31